VVDAASAIYIIGGSTEVPYGNVHDVWASTDGGARPALVGVRRGY
jgi:hypothetical protein